MTLVLVAGAADGETTFIARYEKLPFRSDPNVISTNLTNVAVNIV